MFFFFLLWELKHKLWRKKPRKRVSLTLLVQYIFFINQEYFSALSYKPVNSSCLSNPAVSAQQQVTHSSLIDASIRVQENNQWVCAESGDSCASLMNSGRQHLCRLRTFIKMLKTRKTDQYNWKFLFSKGMYCCGIFKK